MCSCLHSVNAFSWIVVSDEPCMSRDLRSPKLWKVFSAMLNGCLTLATVFK